MGIGCLCYVQERIERKGPLMKKPQLSTIISVGSCLCIIHCVLMPIIFLALPFVRISEDYELWFVGSMYILSLLNIAWGMTRHDSFKPLMFVAAGALAFALAHDSNHHTCLMIVSSICLIVAQLINKSLCRCICHKHEEDFEYEPDSTI